MSQPPPADPVDGPLEIEVEAFDRRRRQEPAPVVVDVREPWEVEVCGFPEAEIVPLGMLAGRIEELPRDREMVIVCHIGQRSLRAAAFLRARGFARAASLRGGVEAWALRIDPTMARY